MNQYRYFEIVCTECGCEFEQRHTEESDGELMFWSPGKTVCDECEAAACDCSKCEQAFFGEGSL